MGKLFPRLVLIGLLLPPASRAGDWPAWRHDAARSAASPDGLPARLRPQWVRHLPALKPAWPDQAKLQVDAAYEPVVLGKRMFVGSSHSDSVTAYDTDTGKELWHFHAEGPVRYPPAAWDGKVYFTSDDGHLYCADAERGALLWKFRGGPSGRKVLGNGRVVSTWPARGGPVVAGGTVTFAAGIWPFMGVFLHCLDARTGKVVWTNDGDSCVYIKQPHNADSFAGVAPQGPLVVAGDRLLVPGRSVPACFDRKTGRLHYYRLADNGKRGGGATVCAADTVFFNGGAAFAVDKGDYLGPLPGHLVVGGRALYAADRGGIRAFDLASAAVKTVDTIDRKGNKVKAVKWTVDETGGVDAEGITALIRAGDRLYAGTDGEVFALDLPLRGQVDPAWRADVDGTIVSLLAADDKLFVVTREGRIYCFGEGGDEPRTYPLPPRVVNSLRALTPQLAERVDHPRGRQSATPKDEWTERAAALVETTGVREGYCVAWGAGSGRLIAELARQTELRIVAVEPDERKARSLREALHEAGVPCERVAVLAGGADSVALPPYLASLAVAEQFPAPGLPMDAATVKAIFHSLRPYGGVACLPLEVRRHEDLTRLVEGGGARVRSAVGWVLLSREGPLPGAANWTHEHGDAANTRVSPDRLVKAPLGVLWFGGPSHDGVLPRHGHGPQPQVIDGRLLIEGVDMLRCMDCYSGRVLWEAKLPGVGAFYNNLAHQPGANSSGTNFISTPDGIYVAYGKSCLRLDPATGRKLAEFALPPPARGRRAGATSTSPATLSSAAPTRSTTPTSARS